MITPKKKKFAQFYDGNATKAAKRAGYSQKTAYSQGQRLLKDADVKLLIQQRDDKQALVGIATRQDRQKFWSDTMKNKKTGMMFRQKASELLAKSEGDFLDKVEHSGEVNTGITIIASKHTVKV